jgi:hypothetical protein
VRLFRQESFVDQQARSEISTNVGSETTILQNSTIRLLLGREAMKLQRCAGYDVVVVTIDFSVWNDSITPPLDVLAGASRQLFSVFLGLRILLLPAANPHKPRI